MAKVDQKCSKCDARLSFDSTAAVDTPVECSNAHKHVIAKCPVNACPAKRIAISSGSKVGKRVDHAGACEARLVVQGRKPTVLVLAP